MPSTLQMKVARSHQEITVNRVSTNGHNEYIVDTTGSSQKTSEISPKVTANRKSGNLPENPAWFQRPIICVSKWSKALKTGVKHSMGLDTDHTAYRGIRRRMTSMAFHSFCSKINEFFITARGEL